MQVSIAESKPITALAQTKYKPENNPVYTLYGAATPDSEGIALGNAVAINQHALATTCQVARGGNIISVHIKGQRKIAKILYHYDDSDICIVGVDNATFVPVKIRPSQLIQVGEEVATIIHAEDGSNNVIKGRISNKYDRAHAPQGTIDTHIKHILEADNLFVLQTDATLSHQLDGSGLFDKYGNLIGITLKDEINGTTSGYIIPTELILKLFPPDNREGVTQVNLRTSPTENAAIVAATNNLTLPSAAQISNPNSTITQIGRFGDDYLGVYKAGNDCFISMTGTNTQTNQHSLVLWFPSEPNFIYAFPHTTQVEEAYIIFQSYEDQDLDLKEANSSLILDNQIHGMLGDAQLNNYFPILVRKMADLVETLADNDAFNIQTKDINPSTIHFGLDGFSEALDAERAFCER